MKLNRYSVATLVAIAGLCGGLIPLGIAQQSQPAQPSNPSPRPSNPSPRPANPSPRPSEPGSPSTTPPSQPGATGPTSPSNPNDPASPNRANNPNNPNDPNNPNRNNQPAQRNARPFAFQNPTDEARFNDGSQKLVRMEQKFEQSNQMLLKRLGEIRQLSPERQSAQTLDLLQQILKSQSEMHQYLVSSRALWTGDIDAAGQSTDAENGSGDSYQRPALQKPAIQQQPVNPRQPVNPPTNPPR